MYVCTYVCTYCMYVGVSTSTLLPTTSAVNSDIVAFASRLSYEEFLHQTDQLNLVDSYPQLATRAARIGYNITKVVYRGYSAPAALQVCVCLYVRVSVCIDHSTVSDMNFCS